MDNKDISSAVNEYLNQKEPSDERFALRTSLGSTMGSQPDFEAEIQKLSAKTGVPLETVRSMPDEVKTQAKINDVKYDELTVDFPLTSKFLSDPKNAAVSHDDIGAMQILENGWKAFKRGIQKGSVQEELGDLHFIDLLGISSPEQTARREKLGADMALIDESMKDDDGLSYFTGQTGYAGRQLVTSVKSGAQGAGLGAAAGVGTALVAGQLGPQVATPEEVLTVPGAAIMGARIGFKGGALIQGFKAEAGFAWSEFKGLKLENGEPIDPLVAKGAAYAVGALNSALEFIALDKLVKIIPQADKILNGGGRNAVKALLKTETGRQALANFGKRWIGAVTTEGITEGLQELSVIIGGELAKVGSGDEITAPTAQGVGEAAGRVIEAGVDAATGAAGLGLIGGAGSRVGRTVKDRIEASKVEQNQTLIRAIGEAGNESKLAQRMPEKYQELIKTIREGGPIENVFIPAEQFNTYFQSKGVDPSIVAQEVGATNYREASAAGTDVMIPIESYASTLARTEHHNALAEDIRFNQSEKTLREYSESLVEQKEQEQKLQALAQQEIKTEEGIRQAEAIKTQFMGNLIAVGTDRMTAEAYATSYARAIVNLAERNGMNPMELAEKYDLSVSRPMPGVLTQDTRSDISIDPMLDAIRAGKIPTEREVYGKNLIEFVKEMGGINPELGGRGELALFDEGKKGFARITNKQSKYSLDKMAEAAVEAGYFPGRESSGQAGVTEAEMLDAISQGESVYSSALTDYNLEQYRNQLLSMQEYLSRMGIDIGAILDNQAIRKMIEQATESMKDSNPDAYEFFQKLLIQHNLTEGNLRFANRLGGLAAPSLAVTSVESPLTSFGEITLIGPTSMADPKSGTRVFGADIYSPRYPDVVYKFKASAFKALEKHFEKELKATKSYIDRNDLERSGPGYLAGQPWAMMKFLEVEGVESDIRYNVPDESTIKAIEKYGLDKYYGIQSYNLTDDEQFQKDAVDAQIAQYKESFDKADFDEFLKAINDPEDLGYRRRIIREWARNVEQAGNAKTNPEFDFGGTRDALRDQIKQLGKEQAFQDYLQSIVERQNPQEKIEKISDSGTRRYIDHTIDNVVAILKRELRGGENFNYGVGSIRSKYAPEFKSVASIKKSEGRLVSKVAFDSIKNEINDEFFALGERLKRFHSASNSFRYFDAVSMMMTDAAKMGIPRALIENQFKGVDRNGIEEIAAFLDKLKNLPTEYFEAKILRGVDLGEFVAAVVPKKTSDETRKILERKGLKVFEYGEGETQSQAIQRAANEMGDQVLFQSASIRSGKETLKKYGLKPGEKYNTRDVAAALEARQRAKYGSIDKTDRSPKALNKIAKWMVEEVMFEMQHPEKSGVGWYSEKFQRALDVFGEVYPELKTDKSARDLATALIAITSDGQKVVPNFAQAIDIYGNFRDSGKFTTTRGHIRQDSIIKNLAKIQSMYDELGADGMREQLMKEAAVSEIKKMATQAGIDFSTEYQAHIKMPMAALIFGPKLGAFYANLMGADGYLTMDRWWSRTFNRYRGGLLTAPTKDSLVRFRQLLAEDKGIDTADMSDDQLLSATVDYRNSYEAKGFKNGTEIEKAANTIYKNAFVDLEDAPFNSKDRTFMIDAVNKARSLLQKQGVDISVADIQAVLWYYEKRLYGELGARQSADISYEEAARRVSDAVRDNLDQSGGPDVSGVLGSADGQADGISSIGSEPFVENSGALYQGGEDNRGYIQIGKDRKMNITLLEKADLSTVLHELGHFYLEVVQDLAAAPNASEQIKSDFQTLLNWFGVTPEQWASFDLEQRREYHEKFARAHEAYLMEGKAPSEELRSIFSKFKDWLKLIYKQLVNLDVQLTDEVRSVFDRIYASDMEIEAAKRDVPTDPLFTTAKEAGLTDAEFEAYNKAIGKQAETAREALLEKLMAEKARETKEWWKKAKAEMTAQVTAEVEATPVYRAFMALKKGQLEDGTPVKLNIDALKNKYGDEYAKRIPRTVKVKVGGMDPDAAAAYLGYESGDKLIEDLVGMKPAGEYIKAEVKDRMVRTYGDMMMDGSVVDEAKAAMHNKAREQVLMTELRLIAKKKREVDPFVKAAMKDYKGRAMAALDVPPVEFFRDTAKAVMDKTMVKDIVPYSYLRAQQKASKQAITAMAKGDFETAQKAKERELLNHHLYLEAVKAKEDADKILDYAKRFDTKATRERIGKAGGDYLQQIDAILDRYEFRRIPLSQLQKRRALLDWVNEQESMGEEPAIDERILDEARQVNYREVPISELRAVRDAVKNIEHIARFKNKLIANNKRIEFQDAVAELTAAAEQNGKGLARPIDPSLTSVGKEISDKVKSIDATLLKMEQLVRWLDGGDVNGPWHTYLWNPIAEAQFKEYDLQKQIGKKITESFEKMPKEQRVSMLDTYDVPGIGKVTKKFIMSIAFNMGNQENIDKMMQGHGWTMTVIEGALRNLTREDWNFVQETWDTISSLWPQIAELEKRMTGIEPVKVTPQPYTARLKDGLSTIDLRGGYFPLKYDPNYSEQGAKQEAGNLGQMFEQGYVRATTSKGHTKARTQFAAPLVMDFEQVITGHLTQVIKDLTHREAIVSANKIITNKEIRGALQAALGVEYERQFMPWLRSVVNDRNTSSIQGAGAATKLAMKVRANVIAATMGYSATTALTQLVGFSASLDMVKAKYLGQAIVDFLKHPVKVRNEINELSGEIRNLEQSRDRDIRAVFQNFTTDQKVIGKVQEMAFHGIALADAMVKVPTWIGAYRQAIAEGKDKETAIREGDAAVRMTQGSGAAKDLSAIQRNNEFWKTMTMFYSYFNVLYNRMRDMGHEVQEIRDMPKFLARAMFTVMIPAVLGDLIVGRGPDEDEDESAWLIRKMLLYPTLSIPIIRDIAASIESGYDYRFTPMATGFEKIGGLVKASGKLAEGDMEWGDYCIKATDTIGFVVGVPGTTQATRTAKYLWRVEQGEENPDNIAELIMHATVGKKPEK